MRKGEHGEEGGRGNKKREPENRRDDRSEGGKSREVITKLHTFYLRVLIFVNCEFSRKFVSVKILVTNFLKSKMGCHMLCLLNTFKVFISLFFREFCPGNPEWEQANEAKFFSTFTTEIRPKST